MTKEQLIQACGPYYGGIKRKDLGDSFMYSAIGVPQRRGEKILPLGYFPTEEAALQALYNYLLANYRISEIK